MAAPAHDEAPLPPADENTTGETDGRGPTALEESKIIDILVGEIRDAGARGTAFTLAGERILATTIAVFVLVGSLAIAGGRPYILMALPFTVGVVVTYTLFLNNEVMISGGYRRALEEEFERRTGVPIFQWELTIARNYHNRVQVYAVLLLLAVFYVAASVLAIVEAVLTDVSGAWGYGFTAWLVAGTAVSIALSAGSIVACYVAQEWGSRRMYSLTRARFRSDD